MWLQGLLKAESRINEAPHRLLITHSMRSFSNLHTLLEQKQKILQKTAEPPETAETWPSPLYTHAHDHSRTKLNM